MILLLFGPPGVGKGTQAELLTRHFDCAKFSTGEILREETAIQSELGKKVETYMSSGVLVPDMLIFEIVDGFLTEHQEDNILFDGFPRNLNQAVSLNTSLSRRNLHLNLALEMYLEETEIINRLINRRYCPECGRLYNLVSNPPRDHGICEKCGKILAKRNDDRETVIRKRLQVYHDETAALAKYYQSLNAYQRVHATGSEDDVFNSIVKIINAHNTEKR